MREPLSYGTDDPAQLAVEKPSRNRFPVTFPRNISWSEIKTYGRCSRLWYWNYEERIEPKLTALPPLMGRVGHAAFAEAFAGRDPQAYIDNWLKEATETHQELTPEGEWLESTEIEVEWETLAFNLKGILERYFRLNLLEGYKVVASEYEFKVPIPGFPYILHGFADAVLEDEEGNHWLYERKFVTYDREKKRYGHFVSEDTLLLNGQIGTYEWALKETGEFNIVGTIYEQILGALPAIPKTVKRNTLNGGRVSIAKCRTDWETFSAKVELMGEEPDDYIELKERIDANVFFVRSFIYRSPEEIHNFFRQLMIRMKDIYEIDMLRRNRIDIEDQVWMVLDYGCPVCPFQPLCYNLIKGREIGNIIETEYQERTRRDRSLDNNVLPEENLTDAESGVKTGEEEEEGEDEG